MAGPVKAKPARPYFETASLCKQSGSHEVTLGSRLGQQWRFMLVCIVQCAGSGSQCIMRIWLAGREVIPSTLQPFLQLISNFIHRPNSVWLARRSHRSL